MLMASYAIEHDAQVEFSIQWLIDGVRHSTDDSTVPLETSPTEILEFVKEYGLLTEAQYAYANGIRQPFPQNDAVYQIFEVETIDNGDVEGMIRMVRSFPLVAAIHVTPGLRTLEAGTVYMGPSTYAGDLASHAVMIVGYGEGPGPHGELRPIFYIRNTWGTDWADGGYGMVHCSVPSLLVRTCYAITPAPRRYY